MEDGRRVMVKVKRGREQIWKRMRGRKKDKHRRGKRVSTYTHLASRAGRGGRNV